MLLLRGGTATSGGGVAYSSVSGGGVTRWTRATGSMYAYSGATEIWYGVVTATGSATITITQPSNLIHAWQCDQWTAPGSDLAWSLVAASPSSTTTAPASSRTLTAPALTGNGLYVSVVTPYQATTLTAPPSPGNFTVAVTQTRLGYAVLPAASGTSTPPSFTASQSTLWSGSAAIFAVAGPVIKGWTGSAWIPGTLKGWTGSQWRTVKAWDGSAWREL